MHVNADSDYNMIYIINLCTHFSQYSADFFSVDNNIIRPFDPDLEARFVFNAPCNCHCSDNGEHRGIVWIDFGPEQKSHCYGRAFRGFPVSAAPAAPAYLFVCYYKCTMRCTFFC